MRSQMFFKLRREGARVFSELGAGEQADSELARRLDVSVERLRTLLQRLDSKSVSLDSPGVGGAQAPIEKLSAANDQENELHERRTAECARLAITAAMQRLDGREQLIVRAHLMADGDEEMSLSALARGLGISRERVRQLQNRALAKLRKLLTSEPNPAFAEWEAKISNDVVRPAVVRRRRKPQRNQTPLAA
jgi:DNA-directed RNA polymerase sigma subunit (sigma70/sigma32)